MRISDCSSDVCSSDLVLCFHLDAHARTDNSQVPWKDIEHHGGRARIGDNIERRIVGHVTGIAAAFGNYAADGGVDRIDLQTLRGLDAGEKLAAPDGEIGRASCRERVWRSV